MAIDLDAVTRADAARRSAREQAELIDLAESFYSGGSSYVDSRGITGVPENRNRVIRASENSFDRMTRLGWSECVSYRNGVATVFRPNRSRGNATSSDARRAQDDRQARRLRLMESTGYATELANE
jgi:hypothetical protein